MAPVVAGAAAVPTNVANTADITKRSISLSAFIVSIDGFTDFADFDECCRIRCA